MTISVALLGTDMIGQARTGTGKTLAFGIPILQRTVAPDDPTTTSLPAAASRRPSIVAPTRELAIQVSEDLAAGRRATAASASSPSTAASPTTPSSTR